MHVKPKEGRTVPDPQRGDILPATGRTVTPTQYWYRRAANGDVTVTAVNSAPEKAVAAPVEVKEGDE